VYKKIIEADWPDRSQPPDLKKILVDFIGVFKGISSPKILIAFAKISYPNIQYLLNSYMGAMLNDGIFVTYLLGKSFVFIISKFLNKFNKSKIFIRVW
jgi:hypothetical protein